MDWFLCLEFKALMDEGVKGYRSLKPVQLNA
jgi:hypothetical protein